MFTVSESGGRRWFGAAVFVLVFLSLIAGLGPISPVTADAACDAMPVGLIGHAPSYYGGPVRVDVQGDYAYVVDWRGSLNVFDVSDPCNPTLMGSSQWYSNEFQDVKVIGDYAYVANDGNGLAKYDISDPTSPFRVGAHIAGTYSVSVDYNDQYLFMSHSYTANPSLAIYDKSTFPASPVATYSVGSNWSWTWEVDVEGNRAYIISENGSLPRFQVLDISTLPGAPVLLGNVDLPTSTYGYGFGLKAAGGYVYLAGADHYPTGTDGGLLVVNVSDSTNPFVEGKVTIPNAGLTFWKRPGLDVQGDMVYVAGQDGLYGFDVSNHADPKQAVLYPYPPEFLLMGSGDVVIQDNLAFVSAFYPDRYPPVSQGGLAIYKLAASNDPPVAVDDTYDVDEDATLDVDIPGVLGNDSDPDNDSLTAILLTEPAHGTLTFNSDGSFVYSPELNYFGADSFTYKANDGAADSDVATVSITINPVNDPPVTANQDLNVNEDETITITIMAIDVEEEPLTFHMEVYPPRGTLKGIGAFTLNYTPIADYNGGDMFRFGVMDASHSYTSGVVYITVLPINDPPTAEAGGPYTITQGSTVTLMGIGDDIDEDVLTYAWDLDNDGVFEKKGQNVIFDSIGLSLINPISMQACDPAGACATDTTTVIVLWPFTGFFSPVDNPPVLNSVKAGSGVPVKFSLGGDQGLNIFAIGYPKSVKITCDTGAPVDGIEETFTAGASSLQYDPLVGQYIYVWKTDKAWAGTCRQFQLMLADGTMHTANFKLK